MERAVHVAKTALEKLGHQVNDYYSPEIVRGLYM